MALLTLENLNVAYDRVQILKSLSLTIAPGEIVALLGSNGAGKTTTVKTISGLIPIRGGQIRFQDRDLTAKAAHDRVAAGLVQVPEGRKIFPTLTVAENLDLGAYLPKPKAQRARSRQRVMEMFPILAQRRNQAAGTLSGGEQQMLALARGLMTLPKLLILDEPSLGLAPLVVEEIFRAVERINAEKVTILLVEQNVGQALAIAHRAYVLEEGQIALCGTGPDLANDDHVRQVYLGMGEACEI